VTVWEPLRQSATSIWVQLLHSSPATCLPTAAPHLLPVYTRLDRFDEILLAVRELSARGPPRRAGSTHSPSPTSARLASSHTWRTPCWKWATLASASTR
jgi:hypothetical protein